MASERGEYRAIRRVLLDGKDFQKLSERARFLFLALKINMGPAGIDVQYPQALAYQLSQQTGMPVDAICEAMRELEQGEWIRSEANVLWIVDQLAFDPHMDPKNANHRKGIQRHVAGLPRLAVVRAFIEHYPAFYEGIECPANGYPMVSEGHGNATAITEYSNKNKTDDIAVSTKLAQAPKVEAPPKGPMVVTLPTAKAGQSAAAPLIREHFWLGKEVPAIVTRSRPQWTMGNEISILQQWVKDYGGGEWEVVLGMIPLFRKVLDIDSDQPLSCLFFHSKDGRHKLNEVLGAYQRLQANEASRPRFGVAI